MDYRQTRALLEKYGIRPKKGLGQNFLTDGRVLDKIVAAAEPDSFGRVLEIGPGLGGLTSRLCAVFKRVTAVEIDPLMCEILRTELSEYGNLTVVNEDILKYDLSFSDKITVCANLPYYISTPIMFKLLESGLDIARIVIMVQKEVADRLTASPGTKDYGSLTLAAARYASAELIANVPPNCFIPRPDVHSAVVRLTSSGRAKGSPEHEKLLSALIKIGFSHRRKTLLNCLLISDLGLTRTQYEKILEETGFRPDVRGETLTLEQYEKLADTVGRFLWIHK